MNADLTIKVEPGVSVPSVAKEMEERLRTSVEELLGFNLGSLAIHVADIAATSDKAEST